MTKEQLKERLRGYVDDWVDRTCDDPQLLKRYGTADLRFHVTFEGTDSADDDDTVEVNHFEAVIEDTRRIDVEELEDA